MQRADSKNGTGRGHFEENPRIVKITDEAALAQLFFFDTNTRTRSLHFPNLVDERKTTNGIPL